MRSFFFALCLFLSFAVFGQVAQHCISKDMTPSAKFDYEPKFAKMEISWYDEWLDYTQGEKILPEPLEPQEKWDHPYMKIGYTAAMHEGPYASDVSNNSGPTLNNPRVQYFHVKQKGGDF